jgi:hypothetical protein
MARSEYVKPETMCDGDFEEFHTATSVRREILSDLVDFNKYLCFTYEDLTAWQAKEEITS